MNARFEALCFSTFWIQQGVMVIQFGFSSGLANQKGE
jgi:hypothetical protein